MPSYQLEVSVTEKCNLGCPYCYVANQDKFMTPEIFDAAWPEFLQLIDRSKAYGGQFHLSFFGGEPLLNVPLMKHVAEKVNTPEYKDRLVGLTMISNLSLITEEIADFLEEYKIGTSWSFDGISANESRPIIKNMGENKGYANVLEMYNDKQHLIRRVTKYNKTCKVMIFPGNIDSMTENFEFLVEFGIPCPDFSIVRDDVWSLEDLHKFRVECRRMADKTIEYYEKGRLISNGMFNLALQDMLLGLSKQKRPFGCFAGHHGSIMSVDGTFYPCARFGSKKLLPMKGTEYNFDYFQSLFNPLAFDKCKGCGLYKVCNAGCTYSQLRNGNKPVDSVCELFHMYYEEAIRIVDKCKDMPVFQTYMKTLWGGRTGFYEPRDIEEKLDVFKMVDESWDKVRNRREETDYAAYNEYRETLEFLQNKPGHNVKKVAQEDPSEQFHGVTGGPAFDPSQLKHKIQPQIA